MRSAQCVMNIREIKPTEYHVLKNFLYEAIFIPEGVDAPPKSIIEKPELQIYVKNFGKFKDDKCLIAEVDGKIIGAIWSRIMNDCGHIDDETPSLAMALYKNFRGQGIGTKLLDEMINLLQNFGYNAVSLSVQKKNFAVKIYKRAGFKVFLENDDDYIMIRNLKDSWAKVKNNS